MLPSAVVTPPPPVVDPTVASLQLGLAVNAGFLVVAAAVSCLMELASGTRTTMWKRCRGKARDAFESLGYACYLSAGSAFFGAIPFGTLKISNHQHFAFVWLFLGMALLALQLFVARVSTKASPHLSRWASLGLGLAMSWWALIGANDIF